MWLREASVQLFCQQLCDNLSEFPFQDSWLWCTLRLEVDRVVKFFGRLKGVWGDRWVTLSLDKSSSCANFKLRASKLRNSSLPLIRDRIDISSITALFMTAVESIAAILSHRTLTVRASRILPRQQVHREVLRTLACRV